MTNDQTTQAPTPDPTWSNDPPTQQAADQVWDQTGVVSYPTSHPSLPPFAYSGPMDDPVLAYQDYADRQQLAAQYVDANAPTMPLDGHRPASPVLVAVLAAVCIGACGLGAWVWAKSTEPPPKPQVERIISTTVEPPPPPVTSTVTEPPPPPPAATETTPVPDEGTSPVQDREYVRLLEQSGWTITDPTQIIRVGHAECQLLGQGWAAVKIIDKVSAQYHITWEAANSQVSSAETVYCPQWSQR